MIAFIFINLSLAMELRKIKNPEALCLDGSKGSYYYREGSGSNSNKYFLYFEGGGFLKGFERGEIITSAYERSFTIFGSSLLLPKTLNLPGVFSTDPALNPEFYNWNIIHMNYCDGTAFQGYVQEPVTHLLKKLHFRGESNFKGVLEEFIQQLQNADTVVLSGASSGGLSTYYWIQYLRDLLPESVKVLGAPDSGIALDIEALDGTTDYRTYITEAAKIVNVERQPPNQACYQRYKSDPWKCSYAEYLVDFITAPIFVVQSNYDKQYFSTLLKTDCASDSTLKKCNSAELAIISKYVQKTRFVIDRFLIKNKQSGSFAISCMEHCFLQRQVYHSDQWISPYPEGLTLAKSIELWVTSGQAQVNRDYLDWPENVGCNSL